MALKKDKEKVVGEHFDDDRIKGFLLFEAPADVNPDYHVLEKAYRGMIPENFATFVTFFAATDRDINASNPEGKTLLELIKTHRHGRDYIAAMLAAGAK